MTSSNSSATTSNDAKLVLKEVSSEYINRKKHEIVLKLVSFSVEKGSIVAMLGPSGSGKTTLLRVIAGFQDYGGDILLDGLDIEKTPIRNRRIAYVSQQRPLYPRLTIFDNIAFPLRMNGMAADEIKARVKEIAKELDIELLLSRKPRQLSGGQCQKAALGKALASYPDMILLDEPLSEVDPSGKCKVYELIRSIRDKYGTTFLIATHDPKEATALADQLVIIDRGEVIQTGAPLDVATHPMNFDVMRIMGGNQ